MNRLTLSRVFWRSFFLQALWNNQGQQNIGFAASIYPAIEKIYDHDETGRDEAVSRYLAPFNTHPYMASSILGSVIKLEENRRDGTGLDADRIERMRIAMSTAFAAIGDAFFWNALLPFTATLALFWALRGSFIGPFLLLIVFNLVHLPMRIGTFYLGYSNGLKVAHIVDRMSLPLFAIRFKTLTAGCLGGLVAWWLMKCSRLYSIDISGMKWLLGVIAIPVILGLARTLRMRFPVEILIYGLLAVLIAASWLISTIEVV